VGGSGAIKFRTSTDGLNLEPVAGTKNGACNTGTLSASQFDLSFDQPVQFSSYQSKAWDAGTYELVVNGTTVSSGNTVGTSTSATSSHAFASTPTLAANTTATLKMVPLASPSRKGDGGKLKSITVDYQSKSSQTISFDTLGNKTYGDAAFSLTATVSSNLAVSYTATGSCTVSGPTVTLTGAGQCTVTASQAGNDQFSAATAVVQSFPIAKATQTLSFTPAKEATLGQSRPLTATAAPSGLSVTFVSTATDVCTVSGTTVQFKAAGTCQIQATQPGNDKYEAAPSVTATIMVYPETQTQTLPNKVIGDTVDLQANSTSGLPVTYSLAPTSQGCALQETTVTTVSVGTCVVVLTQAGNATFYPARTEYRFNIVKETQVITFTPPASANAGEKLMLTAIGGASKNPVTFASSPTNICTVKENTVSFLATGTCTITANQAGSANYNAATQVSANIVVSNAPKTDQTITFSPALTGTVGTTANLTATASSGLTAITFASSPSTVCTINENVISFVSAGNCIVTANQVGNDKFNAAKEVSATIVVSSTQAVKKDQVLTIDSALYVTSGDTAILSATVDSGLTPITFTSYPVEICEVAGNNITYKAEGTCTVVAKPAGNEQFNPVEQKVDVRVMSKGVFSLNFTDADGNFIFQAVEGDNLKIGLTFQANANDVGKTAKFYLKTTAGNTALMLTDKGFVTATEPLQVLTSITLPAEQISLPLYTGVLPAGKYSIYAAYQTADSKEEATSVFTVKAKQTITFWNLPTSATVGEKVDLTLIGGRSNNPIVLTSTTADICTVQNKTVSFVAEGNCKLQATQDANEAFVNGNVTGSISVKSAGVFSLSVIDMMYGDPIVQATDADILDIGLTFKAPTDDIGKIATFYLTASTNTTYLMFANGKWVTAAYPLQAAASSVLPKGEATLPLYSGTLGVGNYTIYAEYQTEDNIVGATSILNVVSKVYIDAYAAAKTDEKSEDYAIAYATAKAAKKPEIYAIAYATAKSAGKSNAYAVAYADAKVDGKFEVYATAYAGAKERGKSERYATAYAAKIATGKLDAYADAYAIAYVAAIANSKSDAYANVYAIAKVEGKSDAYATAYAAKIATGKSDAYATAYADAIEKKKPDTYATAYADAKTARKSERYATAYATAIAEGKSKGYAIAYATAIANGESEASAQAAAGL
jgi:hypothetical protein